MPGIRVNERSVLWVILWASAVLGVASAYAQTATTTEQEPLSEVIVTAQKRQESIREVPLSISAVSGEDLLKRNIKDTVDLAFAVPSLGAYQVSPGKNLLSIRGVSGFRGAGPLVGLYMDEIPLSGGIRLSDGSGLDVQAIDLARVEVLKGPQGTLFGEGAIGGVIRYVTNDPQLDRLAGNARATYSSTQDGGDSAQLAGVLNLPLISDVLGLRITGTRESNAGWIDNVGTGERDFNDSDLTDVRAKVLYAPTARLEISALLDLHRLDYGGQNIVNVEPYERALFRQAVDPFYTTAGHNDFDLYNVSASYDLGFAALLSSSSYFDLDLSGASAWQTQIIPEGAPRGGWEFLINTGVGKQYAFTQELRLTSGGEGPLKWLVGGNYKRTYNEDFANDPTDTGTLVLIPGDPPTFVQNPGGTYGNSLSTGTTAFADGSYTFFDRLELGGGLRYFREERTNDGFSAEGVHLTDQAATFDKTTYRVFVKYRLSENANVYANTATGFRSGGFNSVTAISFGAPATYLPENSIFYETGLKAALFEGRLGVDLALFRGRYEDQIQDAIQPSSTSATGYVQFTTNTGVATIKGVEWQIDLALAGALRLGFSGDVTDTQFTQVSSLAPAKVGDPIDFVPKYNLMLTADYHFDLSANVPGEVNLGFSRKGRMSNLNRGTGIGFEVNESEPLNFLQASVSAQWRGFELTLFGRNLLDERGFLSPQFTAMQPVARPRTFGVTLGKSF